MEQTLKRINLDDVEPSTSPSKTEFLDMNDDCILAIMELLNLDDLYSLGSTCDRINQLAGDVFGRMHSDEWINIKFKLKKIYPKNRDIACILHYEEIKSIVFQHQNKDAQKYFQKYFRSIRVTVHDSIGLHEWFQFMKSKCCPNLKNLMLFNLHCAIYKEHGAVIKNQLAQLESIKINGYYLVHGDIYDGILQYCENLKYLSIYNDRGGNLHSYGPDYYDQFKQFQGEKHPQLKTISCTQVHVNFMRSIVSSVNNLQYLKLGFIHESDIERIYDNLKMACDNGMIKQLELIMSKEQWDQESEFDICRLADLGPLIAIHNTHLNGSDSLHPIRKLVNLNFLKLSLRYGAREMWKIINSLSEIPKLVELDLNVYWLSPLMKFYYLCLPFVQKSPTMKILKLNAPWPSEDRIYYWNLEIITTLDKIRSAIPDAIPLTIRIRAGRHAYEKYYAMLSKIPVGEMVKINLEKYISKAYRR